MNRVLVDGTSDFLRVGVVEDGRLAELFYEDKSQKSILGNIYVGRVAGVLPGMQAAFVDIGEDKNAYYYYGDKRAVTDQSPKKNKPKEGDTLIVQVEKDPIGQKGAVVTKKLSIPGEFLVLLPGQDKNIGISQKITKEEERERIHQCVRSLLPDGFGIIVRTNGINRSVAEYEKELFQLLDVAKKMLEIAPFQKPPMLLYQQASIANKIARDFFTPSIDEVVVNDKRLYDALCLQGVFANQKEKLVFYERKAPLFEEYFVESQGEKALEKKVWLKSGGFLIIEETEACVIIDVNSGKFTGKKDFQKTILQTNKEAALEVAAQIRLRNLSGMIIIDFIDMAMAEDREVLKNTLEKALQKDRVKTVVVGMTELGLMQITRKKTRPSLSAQMTVQCASCKGTGRLPSISFVVGQMRRQVENTFANTIYTVVKVEGDKRLLTQFAGKENWYIQKIEEQFGGKILLASIENSPFGFFSLEKWKE